MGRGGPGATFGNQFFLLVNSSVEVRPEKKLYNYQKSIAMYHKITPTKISIAGHGSYKFVDAKVG